MNIGKSLSYYSFKKLLLCREREDLCWYDLISRFGTITIILIPIVVTILLERIGIQDVIYSSKELAMNGGY